MPSSKTITKNPEKEKERRSKRMVVPPARQERLTEIENDVQTQLSQPYLDPKVMATRGLRFSEGDAVVSCHNGLYYSATIKRHSGVMAPESMYAKGTKMPVEMLVPVVVLHFEGWSSKLDCEVSENELFDASLRGRPVDTLALLVAHEWNILRRDQMGIHERDLGVSAFLMEDRMYAVVEAAWKEDSGHTMSFGQYCGREPGPYFTASS